MPKEIVHMILAQDVCRKIPSDSLFHDAIHRNFNLFLCGAVAPDTCFHYILGPRKSVVNRAGHMFHTTNSSSLVPILEFLKQFPQNDLDVLAFAAGLSCHIITDTLFHPMVYYFSGAEGLHKGAVARHRMFETALDLHARSRINTDENQISFHRISMQLEITDKRLACLLKKIFCLENHECQKYLFYAFKSHRFANRLFASHHLYKLMQVPSYFNFLKEYEVLFYPFKGPVRLKFFDQNLNYKHPVTGVEYKETLEELSKKTIKNSLSLLSIIEASIFAGGNLDDVTLNAGLPKISPCLSENADEFRYWHGDYDIRLKLYDDMMVLKNSP